MTSNLTTSTFINHSLTAILVAPLATLAVGFFTLEFSKPFLKGLNVAAQQQALAPLALGHGHVMMIFGLIPLIMLVAVHFLREKLELSPRRVKWLITWQSLYFVFGFSMLALLIYKGAAVLVLIKDLGDLDLADQALFMGSHALRVSLYSLSHLLMAMTIGGMSVTLLRVLKPNRLDLTSE